MNARLPPISCNQRKTMEAEIKRSMAEYNEKNLLELDSMILWGTYSQFGFREKRLRKMYECFADEVDALGKRYEMDSYDDEVYLCTHKLKDAGIDILKWSKEDTKNGRI